MKRIGLIILAALMLSLTGCIHEYKLSAKGTDMAAEFMAGILLEQDENYQKDLLNKEELETDGDDTDNVKDAEDNDSKPASEEGNETLEEDGKNSFIEPKDGDFTISEVIGVENFNITYKSYKLCSVYPEDESNAYFSLTPLEGNQLLVVSFAVKNITDKEQRLDLRKSKVAYQLDINVGTMYTALLTLLENNLKYINMSIGAGKTEEVLLIFEVSKSVDINNINLIISNGAKTEIIDIK